MSRPMCRGSFGGFAVLVLPLHEGSLARNAWVRGHEVKAQKCSATVLLLQSDGRTSPQSARDISVHEPAAINFRASLFIRFVLN